MAAWKFLLRGREPDVLLDVGRERGSGGNLNFLAVLDQSDGAEKHWNLQKTNETQPERPSVGIAQCAGKRTPFLPSVDVTLDLL